MIGIPSEGTTVRDGETPADAQARLKIAVGTLAVCLAVLVAIGVLLLYDGAAPWMGLAGIMAGGAAAGASTLLD